jgi:hypothetical protein
VLTPTLQEWIALCSPLRTPAPAPSDLARLLDGLASDLARLQPAPGDSDPSWTLWLRTERGSPGDWARYEDLLEAGEVDDRAGYRALWREEYPEPAQWWRLHASRHRDRIYLGLGQVLAFSYGLVDQTLEGIGIRPCALADGAAGHAARLPPGTEPREQYRTLADGRDEGLLGLPLDDPAALAGLFDDFKRGTSPEQGLPFSPRRG